MREASRSEGPRHCLAHALSCPQCLAGRLPRRQGSRQSQTVSRTVPAPQTPEPRPGEGPRPAQGRSWGDRRALSPGPLLPICCLPATLCSVHLRAKEKGENISAPPTVLCLDEAACRPEPGALAAAPPPHAGPWFPLAGRHPARGVREGTCVCAPARRSPHRRCSRHVTDTTCA